ncbi:MAG: antibiotic biosynthesis monooxygenase [Saprospiraceae bacterium]|nr:antibiotic biosynthesis monooxygenase [Saprospiraceae bacterium]
MKFQNIALKILVTILISNSCKKPQQSVFNSDLHNMMIRIAEIEIDSNHTQEYRTILKEESEASIRLEPGVICIYPMYQKNNPTQIRLLEIYSSGEAYKAHLKTPHFQKYKTTTLNMVKSLQLVDMTSIDPTTMSQIFCKIQP